MNNQPTNVLFYSKNCKTCNLFVTSCHQNGILKHFQMICIDDKIQEYVAKGLKMVPTIYIKGFAKPIQGKDVFQWLESTLSLNNANGSAAQRINNDNSQFQVNNNNIKVRSVQVEEENTPKGPIKVRKPTTESGESTPHTPGSSNNTPTPTVKKQPIGYLKDEMEGFSDPFAYLATDNPLPKSFITCDKDNEIYTAPEGPKIDDKKQQDLIRKLERDRDNDKTDFVCRMNLQQKQILYDANKQKK